MSDIASAIIGVANAAARATTERARYDYMSVTSGGPNPRSTSAVPNEETLPGVPLDNHTKREVTESGTHVLVTEHKEYLEKIPVPLTDEELAEALERDREEKRFITKVWAGVAAVGIVVTGAIIAVDRGRKPLILP